MSSYFRLLQIVWNCQFGSVNEVVFLTAAAEKSQAEESMVQHMAMLDDGEDLSHVVFLSVDEVLSLGLKVETSSNERINRVKKNDPLSSTTNHQSFKDNFGVSHVAEAQIWEDLQRTGVADANFTVNNTEPKKYAQGALLIVTFYRVYEEKLD